MLKFDPTTREGQALAGLFRACKDIEDGDGGWDGGDVVQLLSDTFDDLGIDPDGPVSQLDVYPGAPGAPTS